MKILLAIYYIIALALCTSENTDHTPDTYHFIGLVMVILPVIIYKLRTKSDDPDLF